MGINMNSYISEEKPEDLQSKFHGERTGTMGDEDDVHTRRCPV